MKTQYFLLMLLVVQLSCKKNEDPAPPKTPAPLLTYKNYNPTSGSDDWIFISDEDGNIIDTKSFESGEVITLTSAKTLDIQKINVTLLNYTNSSSQESWYFTSYLSIPINQSWEPGKNAALFKPIFSGGAATANFLNYPPGPTSEKVIFSENENGMVLLTSSVSSTNPSASIFLRSNPSKLYFITNKNNSPVYADLPSVAVGSSFTIDYNTLKTPDNVITYTLPGSSNSGTIYGVRNTISGAYPHFIPGLLNSYVYLVPSNIMKLGYNNGFDTYKTSITTYITGGPTKGYFKIGTPPTSIPFLSNTVTVIDDSYKNFSFSSTGNYNMRSTSWFNFASLTTGATTSWITYSPSDGKQKIIALPAEIKNKYPSLNLDVMKYQSTTLTVFLDGFTYTDYVNGLMDVSAASKAVSTEYQTIQLSK